MVLSDDWGWSGEATPSPPLKAMTSEMFFFIRTYTFLRGPSHPPSHLTGSTQSAHVTCPTSARTAALPGAKTVQKGSVKQPPRPYKAATQARHVRKSQRGLKTKHGGGPEQSGCQSRTRWRRSRSARWRTTRLARPRLGEPPRRAAAGSDALSVVRVEY